MEIKVHQTTWSEIQSFRLLFLQENNFQIRFNACHERNWSDTYLLTVNETYVGYGSIKGWEQLTDRDSIFEFYIIPPYRKMSHLIFSKLLTASKAKYIECQSNDLLLTSQLYQFGQHINADAILFEDDSTSEHKKSKAIFRSRLEDDDIFEHKGEPVGEFVLEESGEIIATGGYMLHYNMPFADLYMEVKEDYRLKGYGSFVVQELKKQCYQAGRVPAARCNVLNAGSRATLINAGMKICGFVLKGDVMKF